VTVHTTAVEGYASVSVLQSACVYLCLYAWRGRSVEVRVRAVAW
jgi:hypothetical protein